MRLLGVAGRLSTDGRPCPFVAREGNLEAHVDVERQEKQDSKGLVWREVSEGERYHLCVVRALKSF